MREPSDSGIAAASPLAGPVPKGALACASHIRPGYLATGRVGTPEGPQTPLRQHIDQPDRQVRGLAATVAQTLYLLLLPAFLRHPCILRRDDDVHHGRIRIKMRD